MAIEYTQEEIDTLKAAIVSGVMIVEYDGPPRRKVQYQSLAAMRELLADMTAAVEEEAGTRTTFRRAAHSKGV